MLEQFLTKEKVKQVLLFGLLVLFILLSLAVPAFATSNLIVLEENQEIDTTDMTIIDTIYLDDDDELDAVIADPYYSDKQENKGRVYIFLGKNIEEDAVDLNKADFIFEGKEANSFAGSKIKTLEDQDGDELDEIEITADGESIVIYSREFTSSEKIVFEDGSPLRGVHVGVSVGAGSDCTLNPYGKSKPFNPTSLIWTLPFLALIFFRFQQTKILQHCS